MSEAAIKTLEPTGPLQVVPKSLVLKLAEVMGEVERVAKNGRNEFHRYDYATEADISAAVRGGLAKRGVMIVPSVKKMEWSELPTKNGVQKLCTLTVSFRVIDGETRETLELEMVGQGSDAGDKATYKALTGAEKYMLLKLFLIPTGDDPERDSPEAAPTPQAQTLDRAAQVSRTAELKAKLAAKKPEQQELPEPPPDNVPPPVDYGDYNEEPEPETSAVAMRFGNKKGIPINQLSDKDLGWYQQALMGNVADPAKARFRKSNQADLDAIVSEVRRRKR